MAKRKYFIDAVLFKRIKGFDFSEMNDWIERFYKAAYQDGVDGTPGTDINDALKAIGEVKGIGPKRLQAIKEALDKL